MPRPTEGLPPHMNPMTIDEVTDLLGSTMHGDLPRDTQQRVFATLAAWLHEQDSLQRQLRESRDEIHALRMAHIAVLSDADLEEVKRFVKAQQE